MALELNAGNEICRANLESSEYQERGTGGMIKEGPQFFFFKQKQGSVFPKRRRLVKKMIFDDLVHYIASLCSSSCLPSSSVAPEQSMTKEGTFEAATASEASNGSSSNGKVAVCTYPA